MGEQLLWDYEEKLKIDRELSNEIIQRNWLAYIFITDETCLSLSSKKENLDRLLKITLFREAEDYSSLKDSEIKMLHDEYNIDYIDYTEFTHLYNNPRAARAAIDAKAGFAGFAALAGGVATRGRIPSLLYNIVKYHLKKKKDEKNKNSKETEKNNEC